MHDHELPTPASRLSPGDRISISAAHCLNPSMAGLAKRHVPVACQVRATKEIAGGWLVEGMDCKLFQFSGNPMVTRLIAVVSELDGLKPQTVGVGERFRGVSIE